MAYENVGQVWTPRTLKEYLETITKPAWCRAVTLHHTAAPSLAQRPHGLTPQHIRNLEHFYKVQKGWSAGPHLFVDDDQLWGMCDFRKKGVHSVGFNSKSIGIEVLGDYSSHSGNEDPGSGRGLACWKTAAAGTKVLLDWLGLEPNGTTVLFHREDGVTKKDCPGDKVTKDWVLGLIGTASDAPAETVHGKPPVDVALQESEWRFMGEKWCIPVRTYLLRKGVPQESVVKNLKRADGGFFYGDEFLEGAYYDKATESTWAPVRELMELV